MPQDKRRNIFANRFGHTNPRAHQYATQHAQHYAWNAQHQNNHHHATSSVPASRRYHNKLDQLVPRPEQQARDPPMPGFNRDPTQRGVLDNWFYYGSGNRACPGHCANCGDGGHTAENCRRNVERCQYCHKKVPFKELCNHQLSCEYRTRTCMTCGTKVPVPDFFAHACLCRERVAKNQQACIGA